jgi:hypothetical protein
MIKQMPPHSSLFESTDGNTKFATLNDTNGFQPYFHPTNASSLFISNNNINTNNNINSNNTNSGIVNINTGANISHHLSNNSNFISNSYISNLNNNYTITNSPDSTDDLSTSFRSSTNIFDINNSSNLVNINSNSILANNISNQSEQTINLSIMDDIQNEILDGFFVDGLITDNNNNSNDINNINNTKQLVMTNIANQYTPLDTNTMYNNSNSNLMQQQNMMPLSSSSNSLKNMNPDVNIINIKQEQIYNHYHNEEDDASSSAYSYDGNESYSSSNKLSPFSNSNSITSVNKYEIDFQPTTSSAANQTKSKHNEKKYGPITVRPRKNPAPTLASGRKSKYISLTDEEERKREIRRKRNRQAAEKCKMKRNEIEVRLENSLATLQKEEKQLRCEEEQLIAEKKQLESILKNHIESCSKSSPIDFENILNNNSNMVANSYQNYQTSDNNTQSIYNTSRQQTNPVPSSNHPEYSRYLNYQTQQIDNNNNYMIQQPQHPTYHHSQLLNQTQSIQQQQVHIQTYNQTTNNNLNQWNGI